LETVCSIFKRDVLMLFLIVVIMRNSNYTGAHSSFPFRQGSQFLSSCSRLHFECHSAPGSAHHSASTSRTVSVLCQKSVSSFTGLQWFYFCKVW